jgi:hypothetical protein
VKHSWAVLGARTTRSVSAAALLLLGAAAARAAEDAPAAPQAGGGVPADVDLRPARPGAASTDAAPRAGTPPAGDGIRWTSVALFVAGGATAFLAHEGCHALANFAFGNTPRLERVSFVGVVPFFTVSPGIQCVGDTCVKRDGQPFADGRPGLYTILTAGLQCQHLADEIMLTSEPRLKDREAPFRKGMLAFNTITSVAYVAANWLGAEPAAGDLAGVYRDTRAPRTLTNVLVLGAAALDIARFLAPDAPALPWLSRAAKLGVTGITFTF